MKFTKRILAVALTVALAVSMVACGSDSRDTGDLAKVVAKAGKAEITQGEWDRFSLLASYMQGYDLSQYKDNPEVVNYIKNSLLTMMTGGEMLKQEYDAKDVLGKTYKEDLKAFLDGAKTNLGDWIKANNITEDDLVYFYEMQAYMSKLSEDSAKEVTEKAKKVYYEENKAQYAATEDMVKASHILVKDEKTVNEVLDKLKKGEDFAKLAETYGTDGTKSKGGDLGAFIYTDMIEDFSKVAFALKEGEVSGAVKTEYGYHVIKCTGKLAKGGSQPYEWVEETISQTLGQEKYYNKLAELEKKYKVEYFIEEETTPDETTKDQTTSDGAAKTE